MKKLLDTGIAAHTLLAGRRTPDAGRRTPDAGRRTPDRDVTPGVSRLI